MFVFSRLEHYFPGAETVQSFLSSWHSDQQDFGGGKVGGCSICLYLWVTCNKLCSLLTWDGWVLWVMTSVSRSPWALELLVTRAYSYGYSLMHKPQRLFCLQMQVLGFSKRICRCVHTCVEKTYYNEIGSKMIIELRSPQSLKVRGVGYPWEPAYSSHLSPKAWGPGTQVIYTPDPQLVADLR